MVHDFISKCRLGKLRIGTRPSALALTQATWVGDQLVERFQGIQVEYVKLRTKGDKIVDVQLAKVGGKGLFVKEIEEALLARHIDLAVHSVKDIPTHLPNGLGISAIPKREDPRDALISRDGSTLQALRKGSRVGTSSLRRRALLLKYRKDLQIVPLRGNLDTRIRKMESEDLDAVILASAGLRRMGLEARITEIFPVDQFLPAIGQGALAVETRQDDEEINSLVKCLDHAETRLCIHAERAFLTRLQGGCQVPIGGYAQVQGREMILRGMVADVDGDLMFRNEIHGDALDSEQLGIKLAENILRQGARQILECLYGLADHLGQV